MGEPAHGRRQVDLSRAEALAYGVLLCGTGAVWIAGTAVEPVDQVVPVTDLEVCGHAEFEEPQNLDFCA